MKPEEKAIELVDKMRFMQPHTDRGQDSRQYLAKQCAIICVEELLSFNPALGIVEFYTEVKEEINKL